ncbi:TldD/PmbA family protein [Alkaliphilus transvaalensis]|uniref:TldD/PmbA family protein n=1 Tax=Alkaliphilus transvaalensis TaxID=114628 RepID=UPI00047E8049|nr:TldD/PmbA family protein [Alkaliphilus transvaalensis]
MDIQNLKTAIFEAGKEMGFSDMEISYVSSREFSCDVFKEEIDKYRIAVEGGLSFRGVYNNKMGYAYTEKIDESSVEMLLENARQNAMIIEDEEEEIIFEGSSYYEKIDFYSEDLEKVATEAKLQFLKKLEKACYEYHPMVDQVNHCLYQDETSQRSLYNTKGLSKVEKSNIALGYVSVVVKKEKDIKSSNKLIVTRDFKKLDPEKIASEVVEEALARLGASPVDSKNYPILLKNTAAAGLLSVYSSIFSAVNVQKGRSQLKGKLGEAIASGVVNIVDDPLMKDGVASRSFDSEGVASKKLSLVEDGLLKSLLHNLKTARKDGVESTGNAYKPSYKGTISIAPSNFYIAKGGNNYEDMVASLEEGLIITELQGLHAGANIISGDFSLAAEGYYVKEGKIASPVNQITVAGNFYQLLMDIEMVGNDLAFDFPSSSYIGSPTLKITQLAVSGK